MIGDFISARDRIISASIDIISDAGLESLTIPKISMRTNINEMMIYSYRRLCAVKYLGKLRES